MSSNNYPSRSAYVAPECEALELRFEGIVCTSTSIGQNQDVSESQTFSGFGDWE